MLAQLKNNMFHTTTVCSIELHIDSKGTLLFNWVMMSKKNQLLIIDKSGTFSDTLDAFIKEVATDIPLILSISGKGVLHKRIEQQVSSRESLFDYIFPNARIADYLMQSLACEDQSFFVSVIRKDQVDKIITLFSEKNYSILSVSLGPFSVVPFFKLLHYATEEFNIGKHKVKFSRQIPVQYTYDVLAEESMQPLTLSGQEIPASLLVVYARAFEYLANVSDKVQVDYDLLKDAGEAFKEKKRFRVLIWAGLIFFFLVLLINAFFYTIVADRNDELTERYNGLQRLSVSNKKDVEDFSRKEAFLEKSGWLNPAAMSFYADRIAASLPEQIQLTNLLISPFNESLTRKSKKEIFDHNLIIVKGIAAKPTDINQWTKQLDELKWVTQVKVQDYSFDHKTSKGIFTLYINISDELE